MLQHHDHKYVLSYHFALSAVKLQRVSQNSESYFQNAITAFDIFANTLHLDAPDPAVVCVRHFHAAHEMVPVVVATVAYKESTCT